MRSLGPAGWAAHGFFGFRAKTFGNPGGATSGDGSFNGGGGAPPGMTFTNRGNVTGGVPFVAAASDLLGNTLAVDQNTNVWRSTDGGVTWANVGQMTATPDTTAFGSLVQAAGTWIYGYQGSTVFRSTNLGTTWTAVVTNATAPASGSDPEGAISTDGAGNWVVLTNVGGTLVDGYAVSHDDGVIWAAPGISPVGNIAGVGMLWDGHQFVATIFPGGGFVDIVTSLDGATWSSIATADVQEYPVLFGGTYVTGSASDDRIFFGGSVNALAASAGVSLGSVGLAADISPVLATANGLLVVFDGNAAVASTNINPPAAAADFTLGALNLGGEGQVAACFDVHHLSIVVVGDGGSVVTNP